MKVAFTFRHGVVLLMALFAVRGVWAAVNLLVYVCGAYANL